MSSMTNGRCTSFSFLVSYPTARDWPRILKIKTTPKTSGLQHLFTLMNGVDYSGLIGTLLEGFHAIAIKIGPNFVVFLSFFF